MSNALPGLPVRLTLTLALSIALLATLVNVADARVLRDGAGADAATTIGGGAVAGTPLSKLTARGSKARLPRSGLAIPPANAPAKVQAVIRAGNKIAKKPYKWGGGHGRLRDSGYDYSCLLYTS